MKVAEAIQMLKRLSQTEEICISWWTKDLFDDQPEKYSEECWQFAVDEFDGEEGYAYANQTIYNNLYDAMRQYEAMYLKGKDKEFL